MLAGSAVGTVEFRSITEPVRHINPLAHYIEARATQVDTKDSKVSCESIACEGTSCIIEEFSIPYDRLVIAVGAQTNTFGIPGSSNKAMVNVCPIYLPFLEFGLLIAISFLLT